MPHISSLLNAVPEEILHSSKAVWVAPGSKYLAFATFDDSQVSEHLITRYICSLRTLKFYAVELEIIANC